MMAERDDMIQTISELKLDIRSENREKVREFFRDRKRVEKLDFNYFGDGIYSPLIIELASESYWDIIKGLVTDAKTLGIVLEQQNWKGNSILWHAINQGELEVVKLLIENGVNPNSSVVIFDCHRLINVACNNDDINMVKYLMTLEGMSFDGSSLLRACENGNLELVEMILETGNLETYTNAYGHNALMVACSKGYVEIVKLLITKGVINVNNTLNGDITALYLACENNRVEVVRELLKTKGIIVNLDAHSIKCGLKRNPLHVACNKGCVEIVSMLLEMEEIDVNLSIPRDHYGSSALVGFGRPLTVACHEGHVGVVERLLAHPDIDVNVRDHNNCPLLEIAVCEGSEMIVAMLLDREDLDVNVVGVNRMTPFESACKLLNKELATLFMASMHYHKLIDYNIVGDEIPGVHEFLHGDRVKSRTILRAQMGLGIKDASIFYMTVNSIAMGFLSFKDKINGTVKRGIKICTLLPQEIVMNVANKACLLSNDTIPQAVINSNIDEFRKLFGV